MSAPNHRRALPLTLVGRLIAWLGRMTLVETDADGCRHYASPRGPVAWVFRLFGIGAWCSGAVVLWWVPQYRWDLKARRHEREHYLQACRWGLLLPVLVTLHGAWLLVTFRHPYRDNWCEVAARAAETSTSAVIIPNPE